MPAGVRGGRKPGSWAVAARPSGAGPPSTDQDESNRSVNGGNTYATIVTEAHGAGQPETPHAGGVTATRSVNGRSGADPGASGGRATTA